MDDDDRRRNLQRETQSLKSPDWKLGGLGGHSPGPLPFEEAPTADGELLTTGAGEVTNRPVRKRGRFGRAIRRYFRSHLGSRRGTSSSTDAMGHRLRVLERVKSRPLTLRF